MTPSGDVTPGPAVQSPVASAEEHSPAAMTPPARGSSPEVAALSESEREMTEAINPRLRLAPRGRVDDGMEEAPSRAGGQSPPLAPDRRSHSPAARRPSLRSQGQDPPPRQPRKGKQKGKGKGKPKGKASVKGKAPRKGGKDASSNQLRSPVPRRRPRLVFAAER